MPTVYLNGDYMPLEQARIPVEDRGFLFGDGVYEVVRLYGGRTFRLDAHLRRFVHSAEGTRLPLLETVEKLPGIIEQLKVENNCADGEMYIQYTRGSAHPRTHNFPPVVRPTLLVMPLEMRQPAPQMYAEGVPAITLPDLRWRRCDIKSTMLVPNAMAKQQAREEGAWEAIFVRDGVVTEASSMNVFAVTAGQLATHPADADILGGITRQTVLSVAGELGLSVREEAFTPEQMLAADEVFLTGTTSEVLPLTRIDGQLIADGRPGPMTRRLHDAFHKAVASALSEA
jgi:D-alanine transaminase